MTLVESVVLGLIQGLTEFIPVSSSGHLIIARELLGIQDAVGLSVDAVMQLATVFAGIVYFWPDLMAMVRSFHPAKTFESVDGRNRVLAYALILGTIPSVVFGLILEDAMETTFRDPHNVALALIAGSALFIIAEWISSLYGSRGLVKGIREGFTVGFFQALALIPGISRSGATISGGLILGLTRTEATRFGFLLSIPIIAGSGLKKLYELGVEGYLSLMGLEILVAAAVAGVSGYFAIRFMIYFLKDNTLMYFVAYRLVIAAAVLFLMV
jgi:undecaprenyl-diphosphatase